jgi:hypothetical protein
LKANRVIGRLKSDVIHFKPFTLSLKPSAILIEHQVSSIDNGALSIRIRIDSKNWSIYEN